MLHSTLLGVPTFSYLPTYRNRNLENQTHMGLSWIWSYHKLRWF